MRKSPQQRLAARIEQMETALFGGTSEAMKKFKITWVGTVVQEHEFPNMAEAAAWAKFLAAQQHDKKCQVLSVVEEGHENDPIVYRTCAIDKMVDGMRDSIDKALA